MRKRTDELQPGDRVVLPGGVVRTFASAEATSWVSGGAVIEELLTCADVAALIGVQVRAVYSYMHRGYIPPPDGRVGRTPWWFRSTIVAWQAARPGRGNWGCSS